MYNESVSAFSSIDPSILVNVVSDDTTALLAGLGGAVLGSVVSAFFAWLLHKASINREIENESRQRTSNEKAIALSALVRLQSLINSAIDLRSRIVDCLAEAKAAGYADFQAWQKVMPVAGLPQVAAPFDVSEISLLLEAKHPETANELIRFHSRVQSLIEAMRVYNSLRSKLKDLLPANVRGKLGVSSVTSTEYSKISPTIAECQDLVSQIMAAVWEDCPKGIEVSELLASNLNEYFGDTKYRIEFKAENTRDLSILFDEIDRGDADINKAFSAASVKWPSAYQPQRVFWDDAGRPANSVVIEWT